MPDKKLEKLQKLLEVANQDYATPDEVVQITTSLLNFMKLQRQEVEKKLADLKNLSSSDKASLLRSLDSKEQQLQSTIDALKGKLADAAKQAKEDNAKDKADLEASLSRVEAKIPKRVDLTDIRKQIDDIRNSLPDFRKLITQEPEAIRDALELLQGEDRLDASAIKNLDQYATKQVTGGGWGVVRRLSNLDDVNVQTVRPNEKATLQYQTASGKWLTGVSITVSQTPPSDPKLYDLWVSLP